MVENLKSKTFFGFLWNFARAISQQAINFLVSIILARLLDPSAFGSIALILVVTNIMETFVDCGFGTALVQKKDADNLDFSSVFYFNIAMGAALFVILFFSAPFISTFYKMPQLLWPIRVLGLKLIISSLIGIQKAYVSRKMEFKSFFYASFGATLFSALVGINLAFLGYGIWALIAQQLIGNLVNALILLFVVRWYPQLCFSFERLKRLFSFGGKIFLSSILHSFYMELSQLIVGRMYSPADLAFFNRGAQIPRLIVDNIDISVNNALLPAMSKVQDDITKVRNMTHRSIQISCYLMFPAMTFLFICSEAVIRLLLTDIWIDATIFMQIFCISLAFSPISNANLNAMRAMGRSDIYLKLETIKKFISISIVLIACQFGVIAIAFSRLGYSFIAQVLNATPNRKLLNYSYKDQIMDILPSLTIAIVSGIIAWPILYLKLPIILQILIQGFLICTSYGLTSYLFKIEAFNYIYNTLKPHFSKFI